MSPDSDQDVEVTDWPQCSASNCIGVPLEGAAHCLTDADDSVRSAFLSSLHPNASLDFRGTRISSELLRQILDATRGEDDSPRLSNASFDKAEFIGRADFSKTHFLEETSFWRAQFLGPASFTAAHFHGDAHFNVAEFAAEALFDHAIFDGPSNFGHARFLGTAFFFFTTHAQGASFDEAEFLKDASFSSARFDSSAWFSEAKFGGKAGFQGMEVATELVLDKALFLKADHLGPIFAYQRVGLSGAIFVRPVSIDVITSQLYCVAADFQGGATVRARWAQMVFDGTNFAGPSLISFAQASGQGTGVSGQDYDYQRFYEASFDEGPGQVRSRLLSVRNVDVRNLVLSGLDLAPCLFQGTHHLDQLRIEGSRPFANTPRGWKVGNILRRRPLIWRWTQRQTLREEHYWRASGPLPNDHSGQSHPKRADWHSAEDIPEWFFQGHIVTGARSPDWLTPLEPDQLALLYRSLRKAQEDSKNEPGAADFYYGEMEMRRLDPTTPWGERVVLTLYWLIAGYGLRGLRALASLLITLLVLATLFHLFGLVAETTSSSFLESLIFASKTTLSISSNEELTAWGELLRILLRLSGPILLALAVLSVRNRVKR